MTALEALRRSPRSLVLLAVVVASSSAASAQLLPPDVYEPNDTCAQAAPLGGGTFMTTMKIGTDLDYYRFEVPAGGTLDCTVYSDDFTGWVDHDLTLFEDDCTTALAMSSGWWGEAPITYENPYDVSTTFVLEVRAVGTHGANSAHCTVVVNGVVSACTGTVDQDDGLEPQSGDSDCTQASWVTDGSYSELLVLPRLDADMFRIALPAGERLTVETSFDVLAVDLDSSLGVGCVIWYSPIVAGVATAGGEELSWLNDTGAEVVCYFRVQVTPSFQVGLPYDGCALYDLRVSRTPDAIGTPLCFGDGSTSSLGNGVPCPCGNASAPGEGCANSHGYGATLSASGSTSVAADDLALTTSQARRNQPCLVLQGASRVALPYKDGLLCTGGPTRRIEILMLDAAGVGTTTSSIVAAGHVLPGQTRYYQTWYRDPFATAPCTSRSNFSQALEIVWN